MIALRYINSTLSDNILFGKTISAFGII